MVVSAWTLVSKAKKQIYEFRKIDSKLELGSKLDWKPVERLTASYAPRSELTTLKAKQSLFRKLERLIWTYKNKKINQPSQ